MSSNASLMDRKLAADEARRVGQHEALKSSVEERVESEVEARAARLGAADSARLGAVAHHMRSRAVDEVIDTENEVGRARMLARVSQVVDYAFYVVYALLATRFVLALLAARSGAGFVKLVVGLTDPFYAPFKGIVASHRIDGGHTLVVPLLVAIAAYVLLHLAINGLLRLFVHRKTAV